jgi:tetratricopeptide (TPR) repeat protein
LLAGTDITLERVRRFAEAAAAFYRAAPWQYLTDEDLIRIDQPKGPPGMRVAVVLGNARNTYGLAFYRSAADYFKFRRSVEAGPMGSLPASGVCHVTFEPITDIPLEDADLWEEHGLAVAGNDAYPLPTRLDSQGEIKRPCAAELAHLEAVLWAFSATSESEIDSGRWHKEVQTCDGPTAVTLALPDLLKPPSPRELMRRGFAPDRRAHERLFAEMERYFEEHPAGSVEEMNAVMQSRFTGKTIDEIGSTPVTPVEQAQDLCYQAFDAHGRRCVQLARQALSICPDCADAYVILAEHAGTLEAELDYYTRGVAAGQRVLGAEKYEKAAGHFWGITSTRPYMRARLGLATTLGALGRLEEAVEHFEELLRLNPEDNQGVRYMLLPRLLELGRDAEAARLLKTSDEESAVWAYARALLAFRLSGKSATAQQEIRRAFRTNPYAAEFLLASELPPPPDHYSPGSPEEGAICAAELRPAFAATSGATEWLALEHRRRQRAAAARQKAQRRKRKQGRKKRKDR